MRILILAVATALAAASAVASPPGHDVPTRRFGDDRWRFTGEFANSVLSPDGRRLAVLSLSHQRNTAVVTVFEVATGRPRAVSRLANSDSNLFVQPGLAFSPTGAHLAVVLSLKATVVIAAETGREVWRAKDEENARSPFCAFDPAGRLILAKNTVAHVYDLPSGKLAATWPVEGLDVLTPDAKTYVRVVQEDREIAIGDAATGKPRHVLPLRTVHKGGENGLALSHDGRTLAVVHANSEIHLLDVATGQTRRKWELVAHTLPRVNAEYALAFSPDDRSLSLSTTAQILSWDLEPFRERKALPQGQSEVVRAWHFLSGGVALLIPRRGTVERWNATTGERMPDEFSGGDAFALTPDGAQLLIGDSLGRVGVWNVATGAFARTLAAGPPKGQGVRAVAVSPTGRHVAVSRTEGNLEVLPLDSNANPSGSAASIATAGSAFLAWSPDGRFVYGTQTDKVERQLFVRFSAKENRILKTIDVRNPLTVTPDGREVLYRDQEYSAEFHRYDLAANTQGEKYQNGDRRTLGASRFVGRFSPDGSILALGADHEIELLGTRLPPIDATDPDGSDEGIGSLQLRVPVRSLAFTPNGRWLISGGDCAVKVWEVATGRLVRRFDGHDLPVAQVAVSPDGRSTFSGGRDGFVNQWDLTPPTSNRPATPEELWAAVLTPDPAAGVPAAWRLIGDEKLRAFALQKLPPVSKPDAAKVATRIGELDAPAFADRRAATRELQGFSRTVEVELRDALQKTPSAEVRQRLEGLIARFDKKYSPEEFGAMRLVHACEWHRLKEPLTAWAAGAPAAVLTREAKAALSRLK